MGFLTKYLLQRFLRQCLVDKRHNYAIKEIGNVILIELYNHYTEDNIETLRSILREQIERV